MTYFDTSALMKLVREEAETEALIDWLREHGDEPPVTSTLTCVELVRAARRSRVRHAVDNARHVLGSIDTVPIDDSVIIEAQAVGDDSLRSLDAIHLATALTTSATDSLVTYDSQLIVVAGRLGLDVESPGAENPARV
ncbi:type II toxin-antitoxin system VapC family toxin [Gordonia sp. (in: high G+C Gram-positive bacteria)]|uniref:type II toxin-antitoxin system VapC family toxin n=1 Tax=Gordonia sp. (in: high G+C Gram-positive bacteria) TaxID=84139 RepID=UPI00352831ED